MKGKVCLIYNFAQHYRTNIFMLLDQNLDIDFVFGDHYLNVKKMDYKQLNHQVMEVRNIEIGPVKWQTKVIRLLFKRYKKYIMLGDPMNLTSWLMASGTRMMGKEIYFWTHGWYGRETRLKAFIKKIYFGMANGILLYGNYARDLMIKEGISAKKLTVIHNSLMYDEQLPIRKKLRSTNVFCDHFVNTQPTVVFIGRLTHVKKLDLLLNAQKISNDRGFCFNVAFIGDGTEAQYLKKTTEKLGLTNNVWFYGACYNEEELSQILFDADLCVAPGNIGLTAMHAMVYGCPCISHNDFKWQMPEFEAIRPGITGDFFERGNALSLASCIQGWLETHATDREHVRFACYKEIDEQWNPHNQLKIIKSAIGE